MNIVKELKPTYFDDFKCIGSECEDTCCAGWNIGIDKKSFKKYRKETNPNLKSLLQKNVSRNRQATSDYHYGQFKMDDQDKCSMLNEENLCTIQLTSGEEALCHTCTIYPRSAKSINDSIEKSLDTSCPEAARLILLNPNGIDFVEVEPELPKYNFAQHRQSDEQNQYFWANRMFMISALQHRVHPLEVRLIVIGLYVKKLEELEPAERFVQAQTLSSQYLAYLDDANITDLTTQIKPNYDFQKALTLFFLKDFSARSSRFNQLASCTFDEVNFGDSTESFAQSLLNYKTQYDQSELLQIALENYLVNLTFAEYNESKEDIISFYTLLITNFSLIRLLFIGNGHKFSYTNEEIVATIQIFSKSCLHNTTYINNVKKIISTKQYSQTSQTINLINI
ncbi:hypothetical protein KZO01_18100 [Kurthia zopfii]|uniref:Flagellar biosynthetic protein fliU n=1 Tax=Kurthia zopfii TaxID=1650 RepID=A0A8B4Q8U7_9BACL|nr:flagellin lysine-N-methylase [Kurthia zopfii]PWI22629.1 hypothetical protein DF281_06130 [Kurthia zopfii]TDR39269.1 lysine-N-methylase [Kurthia zopfii]GEK31501.1 hypothetical protein KZO01_18100 [Kurthia zopfii]STX08814.1 Flagellar biosynthetic protein fliU [Kurthia zopfii]